MRGSPFGSDCRDKHCGDRDGVRDGGELLGVAEIVVRVGRDGGTFVLLYLPWDRDLIHNLQQCKFTMEDRQQGTFRGSGIDTMGALNDVKIVLH